MEAFGIPLRGCSCRGGRGGLLASDGGLFARDRFGHSRLLAERAVDPLFEQLPEPGARLLGPPIFEFPG
ncbi:MAG: hypothetical protein ABGY75_00940, partial [Gemmataceae bacterium]